MTPREAHGRRNAASHPPRTSALLGRPFTYLAIVGALLLIPTAALLVVRSLGVFEHGPAGLYYRSSDWTGAAVPSTSASTLDTAELDAAARLLGQSAFSARWVGYFTVDVPGLHEFAVTSDDAAWLAVDGIQVIASGGVRGMLEARRAVHLNRGRHAIEIGTRSTVGHMACARRCCRPRADATKRWRGVSPSASGTCGCARSRPGPR